MTAFLTLHKSVPWETRLVDRYSAPTLVTKLADNGFTMLRHNARETGSDGIDIPLRDILAILQPKPYENGR